MQVLKKYLTVFGYFYQSAVMNYLLFLFGLLIVCVKPLFADVSMLNPNGYVQQTPNSTAESALNNKTSTATQSKKAHHFYLGGGMGVGINYFSPSNNAVAAKNSDHGSLAYRLFAGYDLNKYVSFEGGYTNFGYYQNTASGNSICNQQGLCGFKYAEPFAPSPTYNTEVNVINTIEAYALDLSAIGRYDLFDSFNIFGKAGVSYLNASLNSKTIVNPQIPIGPGASIGPTINQTTNSNSGVFRPLLGAGYEYQPIDTFSVRLEYDYYFSVDMINNKSVNEGALTPSALLLSTVYHF